MYYSSDRISPWFLSFLLLILFTLVPVSSSQLFASPRVNNNVHVVAYHQYYGHHHYYPYYSHSYYYYPYANAYYYPDNYYYPDYNYYYPYDNYYYPNDGLYFQFGIY